jgi:hypothetical protein
MDRLAAPSRARVAVLLTVLLLFFGVALFSPLHKHTLGKSTSCSFNNLEHQMVSLAEAAVVVAPLEFLVEAGAPPVAFDVFAGLVLSARDRAPPSFS